VGGGKSGLFDEVPGALKRSLLFMAGKSAWPMKKSPGGTAEVVSSLLDLEPVDLEIPASNGWAVFQMEKSGA
jgi:hypothetical protein